jgi:putative Mg2+ transporter-C (MgtC) family protein
MELFLDRFGHPTWLPFSVVSGRLLLAAILGALVGAEREWRDRVAGLRTHVLICLSACAIAVLTIEITHLDDFNG